MNSARDRWLEVGDRVFVRRHRTLDVNCGLILGDDRCLVIDTRGNDREGAELHSAVRSISKLPYVVVNTHAHFDHCFGNDVFAAFQPGCEIWSSTGCARTLREDGERQRVAMARWLAEQGEQTLSEELMQATVHPPTHTFEGETTIDLGGRSARLRTLGRGHTDHDVIVEVPGTEVVFVGDLVEQGAAPSFDDSFPSQWAAVLDIVLDLPATVIVPGHGEVVDAAFVARQRAEIAEVGRLGEKLAGASAAEVAAAAQQLAVGPDEGLLGLNRAITQAQPG